MLILIVIWLAFGIASSLVASNRGGSGVLWFVLGCVFGPLALICAFFEGAECPFCRSKIHEKAIICPKCQSNLVDIPPKPVEVNVIPLDEEKIKQMQGELSQKNQKTFMWLMRIFAILVVLTAIIGASLKSTNKSADEDSADKAPASTADSLPQKITSEQVDTPNDWQSYSELYVGSRLINTYEVRYAVEEAIGMPARELRTKVDRRDAWLCTYIRSGKEIEIVYLRDIEPPRNMWAYTIRQRNFVPSPAPPAQKSATPKPWKSVEALRVGNTIINEGELRMYVEALLGESRVGGDGKSLNDSTWVCKYLNEGRDIEITYQWHTQSDYMSVRKIRFR